MAPSCVRPCMQTQKTMSPPWHLGSTGPGELTWEAWKVRGTNLNPKWAQPHQLSQTVCEDPLCIIKWLSLLSFTLTYVTLQTTRCLHQPVVSPLAPGLLAAHLLPSSNSHPSPPTLTHIRHQTITTTCTSLGPHQAFAPWGLQRSEVSWTSTTPSPLLARSDAFRCHPRGRLRW